MHLDRTDRHRSINPTSWAAGPNRAPGLVSASCALVPPIDMGDSSFEVSDGRPALSLRGERGHAHG
jgi:hypothetical protein